MQTEVERLKQQLAAAELRRDYYRDACRLAAMHVLSIYVVSNRAAVNDRARKALRILAEALAAKPADAEGGEA
jgi:hypothetical protein